MLLDTGEQIVGRDLQASDQAQNRRQTYLADSSFDPADLDDGKSGVLREILLRPAATFAQRAYPPAELRDGRLPVHHGSFC